MIVTIIKQILSMNIVIIQEMYATICLVSENAAIETNFLYWP
jgi:hypothetical protein